MKRALLASLQCVSTLALLASLQSGYLFALLAGFEIAIFTLAHSHSSVV